MSLRPSSSSGSPSNTRRKIYKTGIDAEDSRRRREKDLVAVRKIKRQTVLVKKREQRIFRKAIWILGGIANGCPDFRDLILSHGALIILLSQLEPQSSMSIVRAATWSLSVLLRGMPPVDFEQVKIALPALQRLIHATDEDVLTDTCWTLAYLSESHMDNIQAIIELGVCPKLVQLLQYPSDGVILPALLALGNIAVGGGAHTQILPSSNSIATKKTQLLIDNQLLPCLRQLLEREYTRLIFKEASWIIAFITSGTPAQVQAVIDADIIPSLVKVVHNAEFEVKKEAACAIFNVTCIGSDDNIRVLAAEGCIEALCELLTCPEPKLVAICLGGLLIILNVGEADKDEKGNVFAQRLEECGGLEKIETLQLHENSDIHTRALWISDIFRPDNELEDTNMSVS
ncbi:hypothetical protein LR48_Vigan03g266500 [Vigna angularis]|uniref:IBB domain-containing protein n=1 Tax=Phaseolus angularis TaxID=3914 RepID=A0A0L9U929_PHAAN|nr:hypothetical protein LR48_Vigan03g266500 [Vigna angularis]